MARARFFALFVFAAALLTPGELAGQASPLSKQFEVAPPQTSPWPSATHHHWGPAVVELGTAGFAASWATYFTTTDPHDFDRLSDSVTGEWLSPMGTPGGLFLASTQVSSPGGVGEPSLARIGADRFVAVMCQYRDLGSDIWFRRFDAQHGLDEESRALGDIPDYRLDCGPSVASNAEGRFVIAWIRVLNQWSERATWRPMAQVFDADGEPVTPEIEVSLPSPGTQESRPAVGIDAAGNFTVLWQSYHPAQEGGTPAGTWGQRFDAAGNPLGERFRVGGIPGGGLAMTMAPSGGFVAAYGERIAQGMTVRRMRRFVRTGQGVGLLISIPGDVRQTWEPSLDRDRYGNVALFWIEGRKAALALFNKDLVRQGPILYEPPATLLTGLPNSSGKSVALTDEGRIFGVWIGPRARKARDSILGRVWQARKDADLCFFNYGNVYSCDTANDGGGAEQRPFVVVQRGVANDPDARPAAGDFDGDGRDDLCVLQGNRVYCDVDHDNLTAEVASDPFAFEPASGDEAAIGDIDGDGRGDVCIRRNTLWHCDLHQGDGAAPDFTFSFVAGERAMIGDVNGDSRAEACVADRGRFLCDTGHDGGLAETVLDLAPVLPRRFSGAPVLGDVDGDGKDDPCLYGGGRLVCGLFTRKPGLPPRLFELRSNVSDGVPVLADIDAF